MTDDEWKGCCFLMEQGWKGDFDDEKRRAYRVFLDDFEPEAVISALRVLTESGSPFLPAVPEIVQAARRTQEPAVPGWTEAWAGIERALRKKNTEHECLEWLAGNVHAVVARFVQVEGWLLLRRIEFWDPEFGHFRINDLKKRWEEFVAVAKERAAAGRAIAPARSSSPRLLDYATAAGLTPPKQLERPT